MYKIDWERYLSSKRARESSVTIKKDIDKRNEFERDLARVIYCPSIRRMHDKTQVVPLTSGDCILTRLTHSLIVMDIAESLCNNYCRDEEFKEIYGDIWHEYAEQISAIVRAAALAHDIGNPPFGHFGEIAIQNFFKSYLKERIVSDQEAFDFIYFDGNAQGLRVLSKLQYIGNLQGLNLTYATLAAYMKYPNADAPDMSYIGNKKHGVFVTEKDLLNQIVEGCSLKKGKHIKRHPLAFLVEAADSIAYNVMDIEDGFNQKWYDYATLIKFLNDNITKHATGYLKNNGISSFDIVQFLNIKSDCEDEKNKMTMFRVHLIGYLVKLATNNFKNHLQEIDEGNYSKELIEDENELFIVKALQEFSMRYIISQKTVAKVEITGCTVIEGLLNILTKYAFHEDIKTRNKIKGVIADSRLQVTMHEANYITEEFKCFTHEEMYNFDIGTLSPYQKLRLIVDFVSGMTDKFAVEMYQKLSGLRL